MSNIIKPKTGNAKPTPTNLVDREIGYSRTDKKLYINDSGVVVPVVSTVQADYTQTITTADDYVKNKPALGTAALLNVPTTGDAATGELVKGSDTRLTDGRTPLTHTHAQADVVGLSTALSNANTGVGINTTVGGKGADVAPHTMTSNAAPAPYVAAASSFYSGFDPYKAFGGTPAPYWISGNGIALPHWLRIYLGSGKMLFSYAVQVNAVPEPSRAPRDWTFEGSNDAVAWTVLDTRTAQIGWASGGIREFILATQASYSYYRINVSANNGGDVGNTGITQIAELYLYDNSGLITIPAIPTYASNALALAGGLTVGQLYRSGGDPDVVGVVH